MKKVTKSADLTIYRSPHKVGNHFWVAPQESREVRDATNDVAFILYSHYKMLINPDASDIDDDVVGKALGWTPRKVMDYRLQLIKANLIMFVKEGNYTLLFIGKDRVALQQAGLPSNIQDTKTFYAIKKKLGINTIAEMIQRIPEMESEYQEGNYD